MNGETTGLERLILTLHLIVEKEKGDTTGVNPILKGNNLSIPNNPEFDGRKDNRKNQAERAKLSVEQIKKIAKQREEWLEEEKSEAEDNVINNLLKSAEFHFSHSYLTRLHTDYLPIAEENSGKEEEQIRVFEITRWVTDPEEDAIEKLANYYQVFSKSDCSIALLFHRRAEGCRVFMAIRTFNENEDTSVPSAMFNRAKDSLRGNFPGVRYSTDGKNDDDIIQENDDVKKTVLDLLDPNDKRNVAVISNLAGEKSENFRSQTIEKLLDGMRPANKSDEYTVMMLASPISDFEDKARTIANTYTALSAHAVIQKNTTLSESVSVSSTATRGLTVGGGVSSGVKAGIPFIGEGNMNIYVHADGHWDSTMGETKGLDKSKGVSLTYTNYEVKYVLSLLEKTMERLEQCKATGMWDYATYVISEDKPTAGNVAHMYASLIQGEESYLEESAVNIWDGKKAKDGEKAEDGENAKTILEALSALRHPAFTLKREKVGGSLPLVVDATNLFSTIELAHAMNFPRRSVAGFPVNETAAFGRSIAQLDQSRKTNQVEIGQLWHMRSSDGGKATLDTGMLTSHVFITGSTGSGKSNAVYQLLDKLCKEGKEGEEVKHFLVIEPTKGEYKSVFGGRDVAVYGTNYKKTALLRINPFSFPEGVQLYAHLDRLIEIFNACWPMYAAMPAVLKDAVERAYVEAGWDLRTSENKKFGRLFPTFTDVLRQINIVMNDSDYSADSKSDYKGALRTRVKSLTNGIFSEVFSCDELSEAKLFDQNVIVDLSEIGPETTSLIMGILILKLQEHRMATGEINAELKHITVLEEAHNLLKRTSTEQTTEGANLTGKAVEMLTNAIAEMRTYGECFMIVDQSPGALDPAAIRNTNTKILLRLPDYSDRELAGKSIGLNEHQIMELGKLEQGVAAVYQSGWIEAVLCKFDKYPQPGSEYTYASEEQNMVNAAGILLNVVLFGTGFSELASVIRKYKDSIIFASSLPIALKRKVWDACDSPAIEENELAGIAYELLEADTLFAEKKEPGQSEVARQFQRMLRRYQLPDQAIKQADMMNLLDLLRLEQRHRETDYVYGALMGGVR